MNDQPVINGKNFGRWPACCGPCGGVGRGWLLTTDGAAVPLSWTRYATEEPTRYTDANGAPVRFAPGRTWVILVPMQLPATIRFTNGTAGG